VSITNDIRAYLRAKAAHGFRGFTDEALLDYILFHIQNGSLIHLTDGQRVTGVMIGWQQRSPVPVPFLWQAPEPDGGTWYWDVLAAEVPSVAVMLARFFAWRVPICNLLPAVARRNGRTRFYRPGQILTLAQKALAYDTRCNRP
jgi:hypothetical protein